MAPHLLRKIWIALFAACALVLAVTGFAYVSVRAQISAAQWVDHTEVVRIAIVETLSSFEDAESGQRAYLLTGDPTYLEPYAIAAREIPRNIETLRSLTADNDDQRIRIEALARLTTEKLASMKPVTAPPEAVFPEPTRSRIAFDAQSMVRIREIADAMTREEMQLLVIRNEHLDATRETTKRSVELGAIVSTLVLAFTMAAIRRQIREAEMTAARLAESERRFRVLADNASDLVRIHDLDGRATYASPSTERLLGYTPEEACALGPYSLIHPDDRERVREHVATMVRGETPALSIRLRLRRKDGESRWFDTLSRPVTEDGRIVRFQTASRDTTEEMRIADELARSRELYRTLTRHLPDTAVLLFDRDLRYTLVEGDALLRVLDLSKASAEGKTLKEVTTPERVARVLPSYRAALDGEETTIEVVRAGRDFSVQCVPVRAGSDAIVGGLVVVRDVTVVRQNERLLAAQAEDLRAMSLVDELTKLYNRRGFLALATQQIKVSTRKKSPLSIVFCDLNGMKKINDGLGHEQGDQALVDAANILRSTFRDSDITARLGGDEFVVLANDAGDETIERLIDRLQAQVAMQNERGERPFRISISTGVATFDPTHPLSIEELLKQADSRMYENKRSRVTSFAPSHR